MNNIYLIKEKYIVDLNFPFTCSCPNFRLMHEGKGTFCKHIQELIKRLEKNAA